MKNMFRWPWFLLILHGMNLNLVLQVEDTIDRMRKWGGQEISTDKVAASI